MTNIWPDKFTLKNKLAVVTGGAGLIGKNVVRGLAQAGAQVIMGEIDKKAGKELEATCKKEGLDVAYRELDITDEKSLEDIIEFIVNEHEGIDIWVNCAYPHTDDWGGKFEDVHIESVRKNIDLQLSSQFLCCQKAAIHMKKRGQGCIITFGSIYGVVGPRFSIYEGTDMTCEAEYSIIKGGIINFTRYLAAYYGPHNIRVNAICPGGVFDNQNPKFVEGYNKNTPLGRMAQSDEIAGPVIFLASDAASYITGHVLMVDGGWTAW